LEAEGITVRGPALNRRKTAFGLKVRKTAEVMKPNISNLMSVLIGAFLLLL
jgi:hypothetical protein